jgi:hypothetical protein
MECRWIKLGPCGVFEAEGVMSSWLDLKAPKRGVDVL